MIRVCLRVYNPCTNMRPRWGRARGASSPSTNMRPRWGRLQGYPHRIPICDPVGVGCRGILTVSQYATPLGSAAGVSSPSTNMRPRWGRLQGHPHRLPICDPVGVGCRGYPHRLPICDTVGVAYWWTVEKMRDNGIPSEADRSLKILIICHLRNNFLPCFFRAFLPTPPLLFRGKTLLLRSQN